MCVPSLRGASSVVATGFFLFLNRQKKIFSSLRAVDHSAHVSMKTAANCESQCELQDTLIIDVSNAYCGHGNSSMVTSVRGSVSD